MGVLFVDVFRNVALTLLLLYFIFASLPPSQEHAKLMETIRLSCEEVSREKAKEGFVDPSWTEKAIARDARLKVDELLREREIDPRKPGCTGVASGYGGGDHRWKKEGVASLIDERHGYRAVLELPRDKRVPKRLLESTGFDPVRFFRLTSKYYALRFESEVIVYLQELEALGNGFVCLNNKDIATLPKDFPFYAVCMTCSETIGKLINTRHFTRRKSIRKKGAGDDEWCDDEGVDDDSDDDDDADDEGGDDDDDAEGGDDEGAEKGEK